LLAVKITRIWNQLHWTGAHIVLARTLGVWPSTIAHFTFTQFDHIRNNQACEWSIETDTGLIGVGRFSRGSSREIMQAAESCSARSHTGMVDEKTNGDPATYPSEAVVADCVLTYVPISRLLHAGTARALCVDGPDTHADSASSLRRYVELQAQVLSNCACSFGTPPFLEATREEFIEHRKIPCSAARHKFTKRFGDRCPLRDD
jgi:hypothetical protein